MVEPAPSVDVPESPLVHLPLVDRIIAAIGRRNSLDMAELEDFGSWVRTRLVASDYAIFRKFGGRSSMATYLTVVLARMFADYRNHAWGRWRPSAAASRLGPIAIRLERLVYRDGYPLHEAIEVLRSLTPGIPAEELKRVVSSIPSRQVSREVDLESAGQVPAVPADDFWSREDLGERRKVETLIQRLVIDLPAEDRLIVQLRYWQGASVADIARVLGIDQKPLYRRLERIQARLHRELERAGIGRATVSGFLNNDEAA